MEEVNPAQYIQREHSIADKRREFIKMTAAKLKITGMHCHSCVKLIESEVSEAPGVKSITVDLTAGTADIDFDEAVITREQIAAMISELGYQAV